MPAQRGEAQGMRRVIGKVEAAFHRKPWHPGIPESGGAGHDADQRTPSRPEARPSAACQDHTGSQTRRSSSPRSISRDLWLRQDAPHGTALSSFTRSARSAFLDRMVGFTARPRRVPAASTAAKSVAVAQRMADHRRGCDVAGGHVVARPRSQTRRLPESARQAVGSASRNGSASPTVFCTIPHSSVNSGESGLAWYVPLISPPTAPSQARCAPGAPNRRCTAPEPSRSQHDQLGRVIAARGLSEKKAEHRCCVPVNNGIAGLPCVWHSTALLGQDVSIPIYGHKHTQIRHVCRVPKSLHRLYHPCCAGVRRLGTNRRVQPELPGSGYDAGRDA